MMFRLPTGLTWLSVALAGLAIAAGALAAQEYSDRQRLLGSLRAHADKHPEDAAVIAILVACNSRLVVNVKDCGARLIAQVGADNVLARMEKLASEGAFGQKRAPS